MVVFQEEVDTILIGFIGGSLVAPFLGAREIVWYLIFLFAIDAIILFTQKKLLKTTVLILIVLQCLAGAMLYRQIVMVSQWQFPQGIKKTIDVIDNNLLVTKNAFTQNITRALPEPYASFGVSLLMGKAGLPSSLLNEMRATGTTHLIALSGFNISVISLYLFGFLLFLRFHRKLALIVSSILVILFVIMVGGEASLVRAAVMGELLLIAQFIGRRYHFRRAILCAAFGMVLFNPDVVALDIGFQLSFLSTLGITYLSPIFEKRWGGGKSFLDWRSQFYSTLASQIMAFPILITTFHSFSLLAFITNILILFAIPFTMLIVFLTGLVGFISTFLGSVVGMLASFCIGYELSVIHYFSRIPLLLHFSLGNASLVFIVFYYSFLAIFVSRFWSVRYGKR
ncbi:MAG: ComEC/Rec2 family competence protein [Parcubacteria group bacterium]|nr:ComEC/Rec2 family competence protein [Parcubacteria group bacterium]